MGNQCQNCQALHPAHQIWYQVSSCIVKNDESVTRDAGDNTFIKFPDHRPRGSLLQIQIVWRKWGKISEEIPELLDIDSWRHSHKTLNMSTCLLSTLHCFLQLPPALEPELIWLFMWSSKRHFSAVNQKPAAVSRIFSAWIKDPVQWAWEVVHRQTQIGKFAENLGQNMWLLILILLSSKTGEIDCPAAGPRDTDGADDSRCRPVCDVWFLQTSKGTRQNLEKFPHLLP